MAIESICIALHVMLHDDFPTMLYILCWIVRSGDYEQILLWKYAIYIVCVCNELHFNRLHIQRTDAHTQQIYYACNIVNNSPH